MDALLNYQTASEHFGLGPNGKPLVSVFRLRRAVARKALKAIKFGHRTVFFRPVDLDRWASRHMQQSTN